MILSGRKDEGKFAKHDFSYIAPGGKEEIVLSIYMNLNQYYDTLSQQKSGERQEDLEDSILLQEEESAGQKRRFTDKEQTQLNKKKKSNSVEDLGKDWKEFPLNDVRVFSNISDFVSDLGSYLKFLISFQRNNAKNLGRGDARFYQ